MLGATPLRPRIAFVLGSGFGRVADTLRDVVTLPYRRIPGFAATAVEGHAGRVLAGCLDGAPVWLLCGRAHFYEGHTLDRVTFPIRALAAAGVRAVVLTNAAGGIRRGLRPGDFMRLTDHINFMGQNPLRGACPPGLVRFVDLSQVYDTTLGRVLDAAGRSIGRPLKRGVYLAVSGPSYETPAEIRAFRRLGADAVGMSTVPEAIVARQCGLRVAGLSCITNLAAGLSRAPLSHAEVLRTSARTGRDAARLVTAVAQRLIEAAPWTTPTPE
jgi:purine-nucleoside phosphorylase